MGAISEMPAFCGARNMWRKAVCLFAMATPAADSVNAANMHCAGAGAARVFHALTGGSKLANNLPHLDAVPVRMACDVVAHRFLPSPFFFRAGVRIVLHLILHF